MKTSLHDHPTYGTYSKTLQDFVYVPGSSLAGGFLKEKGNVFFFLIIPLVHLIFSIWSKLGILGGGEDF